MENSVIAIQVADGTFVPILSTANKSRRRLVVTTVRDGQTNLQVELFRASDESLADPQYVGSLMIQNIGEAPAGQPDVTVLLGVDDDGNLNATATDDSSGAYESLSISLEQLGSDEQMTDADFDLPDSDLEFPDGEIGDPSNLEGLEGDIDSDDLSLDDLSFDPLPQPGDGVASGDEQPDDDPFASFAEDDDLLFEDVDDENVFEAATSDSVTTADDDAPVDDRSIDDLSIDAADDQVEDELDLLAGEDDETLDALLDDTDDELDSLTLDEDGSDGDTLGTLDDAEEPEDEPQPSSESSIEGFSDDDFGFDDSFSLDDEPSPGAAADDASSDDPFATDDDFSISELTEEESDASQQSVFDDEEATEEIADLGDEDFSFDEDAEDPAVIAAADELSPEEFNRLDAAPPRGDESFSGDESPAEDEPLAARRSNGVIFAGYLILALAALGVLAYLVFRLLEGPPAPPLRGVSGGLRAVATMMPLWLRPLKKDG